MKSWKAAFILLMMIFVLSSAVFFYKLIDQAYTISYTNDSYEWVKQENLLLTTIINSKLQSRKEIENFIKSYTTAQANIAPTDTIYWYNQSIIFNNDTLLKIVNTP